MELLDHIVDTVKEWELKLGKIDSDIRLYYPPDTLCEFLHLKEDTEEEVILLKVKEYLSEQGSFLGKVMVEAAKDHRIGVAIPKEGSEYIARHIETPVFLKGLLDVLKKQNLDAVKEWFSDYASAHDGMAYMDTEEDGIGAVMYFDREDIDPYVYCFDSDAFGVTYHRFSKADYEKLK